jgi:hypothetical protein
VLRTRGNSFPSATGKEIACNDGGGMKKQYRIRQGSIAYYALALFEALGLFFCLVVWYFVICLIGG